MIREDLLYYVWRTKSFDLKKLSTTQGQTLEILNFGYRNDDAGPDFLNAKIRIGGILWAGHVEMHVFASDWNKHGHQSDPAYDSVALHVVFEDDEIVKRKDGSTIPTLVLKQRISRQVSANYLKLQSRRLWIPCEAQISTVHPNEINIWLETLLVERLNDKCNRLLKIVEEVNGDWEECLYITLARYMGSKVNGDAFEMVARNTPRRIILKHRSHLEDIEALLFGQAGFLNFDAKDDYPLRLKSEYQFLAVKYHLEQIPMSYWKLLRMRPQNFPTIRLSQWAAILYKHPFLFGKLIDCEHSDQFYEIFNQKASLYWEDHYLFEKPSPMKEKMIGKATITSLAINALIPLLFLYGKMTANRKYVEKAIHLIGQFDFEKNKITKAWLKLGLNGHSAAQSQALIQLKSKYCDAKRCLQCKIGHSILKS